MVYGDLDLPEEVQDQIQWIHIYNLGEVYAPPFKSPVVARFFPNGDSCAENVKPGMADALEEAGTTRARELAGIGRLTRSDRAARVSKLP
jgi:hypothetical protein